MARKCSSPTGCRSPEVGLALQEAVPARHDHAAAAERDAEAFLRNVYLCQE
jgi:hypothetical protein